MYRNIAYRPSGDGKSGIIELFTWDENGERIHKSIPHCCHVLYEVPYETKIKSIFNTHLMKKEFNTKKERFNWIKNNKDSKKIFECFEPEYEFMNALYHKIYEDDDFQKYPLKIHYLDIELAVGDSNIKLSEYPKEVPDPINLITVYDNFDGIYHTWALDECKKHIENADVRIFDNEFDLLKDYIKWHSSDYPDIITTWNGKSFDIPYICNRIKKVIGKKYVRKLSPIGKVTSYTDKETDELTFTISCISHLDYYILYKFKYLEKSNGRYSLGNVGEFKLDLPKFDYVGSIKDFYKRDFQKFYEYNVRDVEIIVKLEEKIKLIELSRKICNMGLSPYEKIYSSIPYLINALTLYAYNKGKIFPSYRQHLKEKYRFKGAYVFPVKSGFYQNGVSIIDLNSLYPNTTISCNMSPETKVGTFKKKSDGTYEIYTVTNVTKVVTEEQFINLLKTKCIKTENNTLFLKHSIRQGIVSGYSEMVYNQRKTYKKKKHNTICLSKKSENKDEIDRYKNDELVADLTQKALKTMINSIYGMFGTEYSPIYDIDIAQSITLNGQMVIKSIPYIINKYMNDNYGTDRDVVIFGDTDSTGFDYKDAIDKYCKDNNIIIDNLKRKDIKNICSELDEFVDNVINKHCQNLVNTRCYTERGNCIVFEREKFCMNAMFFSKKHYILHIIDKDGIGVDEFDYKGIDIAKNELSPKIKSILKPIYENICREKWSGTKFKSELQRIWDEYSNLNIYDISRNSGWGTDKDVTGFLTLQKGALAHVKASVFYNQIIKKMGIQSSYSELTVGDAVQWCYIDPNNPYKIPVIGFKDRWPDEFDKCFVIDYELMFEKNILKPLEPLVKIMNWNLFNPSDQSEVDIFGV